MVEPARGTLDVVTTDTLVEGVHFDRSFMSAPDIGHRTLAVNLSDLAAMGATPRAAVLSLVLPAAMAAAELDGVVEGLLALAARHRVALVGGNVTRTHGPLVLGVTAVGAVRRRRVLTRDGGRPGDELWVTGTVGAAATGLAALRREPAAGPASDPDLDDCIRRYRRPEPRVRIGALLGRNRVAGAGIDLSDGLADGLRQLTRASGAGAAVEAAAIPVHPGARRWFDRTGSDPVEAALRGGDDYELLIAVPRRRRRALRMLARLFRGVPVTRIGELTKTPDVVLRTANGDRAAPPGYEHFRGARAAGRTA